MKFGEKLKQGRLRADMTQEAVARRSGVSRQSLSNWENDRTYPDLASVIKLSDLYGISLDELLREDLELRRQMERRQEKVKTYSSWLHDVAMLMIASNLLLSWLDKTGLGIALGVIGLALIGVATEEISFKRQDVVNRSEVIEDIMKMRSDIDLETALELNPYVMQEQIAEIMANVAAEQLSGMPSMQHLETLAQEAE